MADVNKLIISFCTFAHLHICTFAQIDIRPKLLVHLQRQGVFKIMNTKTQLARLAELIKSKRTERGFSQAELGRRLGVTQVTVFNWENQRVMPDTSNVNKIAGIFSMSPEELWAYLDGNDRGKEGLDVNRILRALDSMSVGDLTTIINAGVQKLAKAS